MFFLKAIYFLLILSLSKPEHLNVTTFLGLSDMSSFIWGFLRRVEIRRTQSLDNELRWLLLIPADRATSNDPGSEFYTGLSLNPNFAH